MVECLEKIKLIYLATELEFEQEVEHCVGQTASEGMLEVDLVALDHQVGVFAAP